MYYSTPKLIVAAALLLQISAAHAVVYRVGVAPGADASLTFGNHLISPDPHSSVAGIGGSGLSSAGDALDGQRTYIYDHGAQPDLTAGFARRGSSGFAMMIWDMGSAFDSMRLYTHQDHYAGGPVFDPFVGQDLMEYSVWGSRDGDDFVLLSDVIAFDLNGDGAGVPTFTFGGTAPSVVYRGGSAEFGIKNAYTREYVFDTAYRYYGVRTSQISLSAGDADPELDAVAGFNAADRCVVNPSDPSCRSGKLPEPGTLFLLGSALAFLKRSRSKSGRSPTSPEPIC